jgi:hypothetical protein
MAKRKPRTRSPRTMPPAGAPTAPEAVASSGGRRTDFSTEYHYVIEDLKRIGIIAAILIAGLLTLSFFL